VTFWVGKGADTSLLVVDFLDGAGTSSFAWGYLHSGATTAEQMLTDIDAADPNLSVVINSGFLTDITYKTHSGIGGNPDYWGTWSATNLGNWDMNLGISTSLGKGDLFGCSYMNFNPVIRPGYPTAATPPSAIFDDHRYVNPVIYPNPATDFLNIDFSPCTDKNIKIKITDLSGKTIISKTANDSKIDVSGLKNGIYIIQIAGTNHCINYKFVKK